jgi:hypothetical protein
MEFHSINKAVVQIPAMCLYNGSDDATLLVLVGRGGGRKEKRASTACVRYMGVGQSLQPLQEASKRWCRFAAAIRPWEWPCCPRACLLEDIQPPSEESSRPRRVCASSCSPKWCCPRWEQGCLWRVACLRRRRTVLDRVFGTLSRVLCAKFTDCAVIYTFFKVLLVILYPPPYKCRL